MSMFALPFVIMLCTMDRMRKLTRCSKCGDQLNGTKALCRPCNAKRARAWRSANPDKAKAIVKRYQTSDRQRYLDNNRRAKMRQHYGITPEDYDRMLSDQDGKCAICRTSKVNGPSRKYFSVDHCHTTLKVRGLLCHHCNLLIGHSHESVEILTAAIQYLKSHVIVR